MSDDQRLIDVEGKIWGLQVLLRGIMSGMFRNGPGEPLEQLDKYRNDTFSTLQNADRPVNDHADAVWEAMTVSLEEEFDAIGMRLRDPRNRLV